MSKGVLTFVILILSIQGSPFGGPWYSTPVSAPSIVTFSKVVVGQGVIGAAGWGEGLLGSSLSPTAAP